MRTCLPLRLSAQQKRRQHAELAVQTAEKLATALAASRCFATRPAIHFSTHLSTLFFFPLGLGAEGRLKNRFDFAERAPCQSMYVLCFSRRCRWRSCGIIESPGFVVLPGRVEDRCCVLHRRWLGWRLDPEVSVPVPTTGREFAAKLFIAPCARSPCF